MTESLNIALKTFNPNQVTAVQTLDGPLLVSAGAGSGKTRVLTYRIAHLIKKKKAAQDQILAVTFTNKAANEMRERVNKLIQDWNIPLQGRMWISTFHSICARILKDNKKLINHTSTFTIYDNKDQLSLVKKVMKDLNINEKVYNPKTFSSQIALCKRQALGPEDIDRSNFPAYGNRFQDLYFNYEEELKMAGAFDFEGLLFETYKFFLKSQEHLEKYRKQFLYISVDEYQDTNHIQYLIIKTLAEKHRNICVVGDEDQSIYSWRGADISNILNFDRDFPECKIIKLEQNYRSTGNIISASSALINYNKNRKDKKLFTDNLQGSLIQVYELEDEIKEAHLITNIIETQCREQDFSYEDFAIFYRTNAQSRVLEDALRSRNIPYKIIGNLKFYDRLEIKDILSYLKCIANPKDEVSLKRILNSPKRGIGTLTIRNITEQSELLKKSFYETMKYLSETNQIKGTARVGIMEFIQTMEYLKRAQHIMPLVDLYKEIMEKTNYNTILKEGNSIESLSRLENLQEFGNVINQFEMENEKSSLTTFLEETALLTPSDPSSKDLSGITLMTLHVSKGLEFNTVFITGMEEGLFPLSGTPGDNHLEEERRLAYVGMTRAKKNLYLSYAIQRNKFGKKQYNLASRFLKEIPSEFIRANSLTKKYSFISKKHRNHYDPNRLSSTYTKNPSVFKSRNSFSSPYGKMYKVGRVVHHPHFGAGKIQKIEGSGDDLRVSVIFKNNKVKKFIAKYAHLSV
ncbi:MAG: UvrD-helicase domain-containing protein [Bdellovibrionales bacterium]|nr:UvrD-helicase domain-containing protein [Bdellovibrionales bacterium]